MSDAPDCETAAIPADGRHERPSLSAGVADVSASDGEPAASGRGERIDEAVGVASEKAGADTSACAGLPLDDASECGRRERKKRETRRALHAAALRLVLERGLEGVTANDVADEAGVSPRTFFNYFPTKEAALMGQRAEFAAHVTAWVAAQPASEGPWVTCRRLATWLATAGTADEEAWLARRAVIRARPEVAPIILGGHQKVQEVLVQALRGRRDALGWGGPAWRVDLMALAAVDAVRVAMRLSEQPGDVAGLLDEIVDGLDPAFAD